MEQMFTSIQFWLPNKCKNYENKPRELKVLQRCACFYLPAHPFPLIYLFLKSPMSKPTVHIYLCSHLNVHHVSMKCSVRACKALMERCYDDCKSKELMLYTALRRVLCSLQWIPWTCLQRDSVTLPWRTDTCWRPGTWPSLLRWFFQSPSALPATRWCRCGTVCGRFGSGWGWSEWTCKGSRTLGYPEQSLAAAGGLVALRVKKSCKGSWDKGHKTTESLKVATWYNSY